MRIPEIKDTCVITGGEHKGRFGRVVGRGIMMGQDAVSVQLRAEDGKPVEQVDIPVTGIRLQPDPKGPVSEATLDGKPVSEYRKEIGAAAASTVELPVDPLPLPPLDDKPAEIIEHVVVESESATDEDGDYTIVELPEELQPVYDLLSSGPATNKQLLKLDQKYRKRLDALRAWLEANTGQSILSRPISSGVTEYRIVPLEWNPSECQGQTLSS